MTDWLPSAEGEVKITVGNRLIRIAVALTRSTGEHIVKTRRRIFLAVRTAVLAATFFAYGEMSWAALVEADLLSPGDKLLTQDTQTGLSWLDVTATQGLSYNDVAGGAGGWIGMGFRFANITELATLFSNAGIPDLSGVPTSADNAGVSTLINLMGSTNCNLDGSPCVQGWVDKDPLNPSYGLFPFAYISGSESAATGPGFPFGDVAKTSATPNAGSFLVSVTAVPLPGAVWLFGSGLIGLLGAIRRRLPL